jgi:hypothetical protein
LIVGVNRKNTLHVVAHFKLPFEPATIDPGQGAGGISLTRGKIRSSFIKEAFSGRSVSSFSLSLTRRVAMGEEKLEKRFEDVEVRCDICRKTFPLSEEGKKCPECQIGRLWLMDKAA